MHATFDNFQVGMAATRWWRSPSKYILVWPPNILSRSCVLSPSDAEPDATWWSSRGAPQVAAGTSANLNTSKRGTLGPIGWRISIANCNS